MKRWNDWKGIHAYREKILTELQRVDHIVKFDRFEQTEKAWIIFIGTNSYVFPKSKTVLFENNNTIQVPNWLYVKNFKEDDKKDF